MLDSGGFTSSGISTDKIQMSWKAHITLSDLQLGNLHEYFRQKYAFSLNLQLKETSDECISVFFSSSENM